MNHSNHSNHNESRICRTQLTEKEYFEHMIPHHQVAIDISKILIKQSKWTEILDILRKLIWTQEAEINIMKQFLNLYEDCNNNTSKKEYIYTKGDFTKPNVPNISKVYCDPLFFDPKEHMVHAKHVTDDSYIDHMIPHHQVAIDMSKTLLKYTNNPTITSFAYRIIRSQQHEIYLLNELKTSYRNYIIN